MKGDWSKSGTHYKGNTYRFDELVDDTEIVESVESNKTLKSFECLPVGMAEIRTPGPEKIEFHSDRQRHLLVDNSSATQVDSAVVTGVTTTFRINT